MAGRTKYTEKRKPTFDLASFKVDFQDEQVEITVTELNGARALGFDRDLMSEVVATMEHRHFIKSATSYGDHRVWMDSYEVSYDALKLFIKFTAGAVTAFRLTSFKEH